MQWYSEDLVRVETCNFHCSGGAEDDCLTKMDVQCYLFKQLSCAIQQELLQQEMLNVEALGLTGSIILTLSKQLADYQALLHNIACKLDAEIEFRERRWKVKDFEKDYQCGYDRRVLPIPCVNRRKEPNCEDGTNQHKYPLICQRYFWGCNWGFSSDWQFQESDLCRFESLRPLICRLRDIMKGLHCIFRRTPVNLYLRQLIHHTYCQAKCLKRLVRRSERYYHRQYRRAYKAQRRNHRQAQGHQGSRHHGHHQEQQCDQSHQGQYAPEQSRQSHQGLMGQYNPEYDEVIEEIEPTASSIVPTIGHGKKSSSPAQLRQGSPRRSRHSSPGDNEDDDNIASAWAGSGILMAQVGDARDSA